MAGIITTLVNALTTAGAPSSVITGTLQQVFAESPNADIQQICRVLMANSSNAEVIKDAATRLANVQNLPASVVGIIPQLQAAATQVPVNAMQVTMIVMGIEAAIQGTNNPFSIF